jgi:TnpA family transposase
MYLKKMLTNTERKSLFSLPETREEFIRHYTLNKSDMSLIYQRRGDANRLGFAVQLCLLRFPGYPLSTKMTIPDPAIKWIAKQAQVESNAWQKYSNRDGTRREHLHELRTYLGLKHFGKNESRSLLKSLINLAMQTDKGQALCSSCC